MSTSTRHIDAPATTTFDTLVDAPSYPKWLIGAKHVVTVDGEWPEPGSGFTHRSGIGPIESKDRTTVSAIEPGRRLDLVVRARPFVEADVHFEVEANDGASTLRMTERPRGPFRVLAPLMAPVIKWRNDRSLEHFAVLVGERR